MTPRRRGQHRRAATLVPAPAEQAFRLLQSCILVAHGGSMESKAKLLGHSVHQMLIVFPLGLLATAVVFDLLWLGSHNAVMATVSFWMMAAGIVGAVVAAPFGLIDWLAIAP